MNDSVAAFRTTALASVALLLGACVPEAEDRITSAVPVAANVVELHGQLAAEAQADKAFAAEYAGRVRMRAIECSRGRRFDWWISDAELKKALAPERECFAVADEALLRWLQRRQVGLRLAQPPLLPMPSKPIPVLGGRNLAQGVARHVAFAAEAGVAAVAYDGAVVFYDTSNGGVVGSLSMPIVGPVALSPNGRVAAIGVEGGLRLRGVDGADFGSLDAAAQGRSWWLSPGVLAYDDARDDTLRVVDFQQAIEARVPELTGVHGVVALHDQPGRALMLSRQGAALVVVPPEGSPYRPDVSIATLPGLSMIEGDRAITEDGDVYGLAEGGLRKARRDADASVLKFDGKLREYDLGTLSLQGVQASGDPDRLLLALPGRYGLHWFAYSLSSHEFAALDPQLAADARLEYVPAIRRNVLIDADGVRVLDRIGLARPEPFHVLEQRYAADKSTLALVDVEPAPAKVASAPLPAKAATPVVAAAAPKGPYAMINGREVPTTPVEPPSGPFAQINGRVIAVPEAKPSPPRAPAPPGPPKKGREALVDGLRSGVLRLATEDDLNQWRRAYEQHARHGVPREFNERIDIGTMYVITGDFTIPDDLTGGASAVFILQRGVPFPNGEASHSPILDISSGACVGWVCRSLSQRD